MNLDDDTQAWIYFAGQALNMLDVDKTMTADLTVGLKPGENASDLAFDIADAMIRVVEHRRSNHLWPYTAIIDFGADALHRYLAGWERDHPGVKPPVPLVRYPRGDILLPRNLEDLVDTIQKYEQREAPK